MSISGEQLLVHRLPRRAAYLCIKPVAGFDWHEGLCWRDNDRTPAGSVLVPRAGLQAPVVRARGRYLLDRFAGLGRVTDKSLWGAVRQFADEHGWLGVQEEFTTPSGEAVVGERLLDWTARSREVADLAALVDAAAALDAGSTTEGDGVMSRLIFEDERALAFRLGSGRVELPDQFAEALASVPGRPADVARMARYFVAVTVGMRLAGRMRVAFTGFPSPTAAAISGAQRGMAFVPDSLLAALYFEVASELVGRASLQRRCVECGVLFSPQRRRDAKTCSERCRSRRSYKLRTVDKEAKA